MTRRLWRGVWVSDRPLDENEGAQGNTVIAVELPAEVFARHEWVQEPSFGYREALIPASTINRYVRTVWEED